MGKFWKFQRGRGGKLWGLISENPEGKRGHMANPFHGGGKDIFWNHTIAIKVAVILRAKMLNVKSVFQINIVLVFVSK